MPTNAVFSKRFKDWAKETGFKQYHIASKIGVSEATITRWLNGHAINHENLIALIKFSGHDANFWLAPEPEEAIA